MRLLSRCSRLRCAPLLSLSVLFLTLSFLLLSAHAQAVASMRRTGLPAALRLRQIEARASVLREQNDAAELQAALRTGTEEEILRISVLPDEPALDRLLATLDLVFSHLQDLAVLREFPTVTVGEARERSAGGSEWQSVPVTFTVAATEEGVDILFAFLRTAGMLTVSDLLSPEDISRLLTLTEDQNPAAITALEEFLSVDLLRFAVSPRPYQDQLLGALSAPLFAQELTAMLDLPSRRSGLALLHDLAPALRERHLWPVRFLSVADARMEGVSDPWMTASFTLEAAGRTPHQR